VYQQFYAVFLPFPDGIALGIALADSIVSMKASLILFYCQHFALSSRDCSFGQPIYSGLLLSRNRNRRIIVSSRIVSWYGVRYASLAVRDR